jgi:2-aminoadipate transaminase
MHDHLTRTMKSLTTGEMFAERMKNVPRSFIREILKIAISPDIISFAGGLPNAGIFPVDSFRMAAERVLRNSGKEALQYSNTEGFFSLREYIADRYKKVQGIEIMPDNILITSGSQQGLDLLGKIFLNKGDGVILEEPGYLGAIQAFSLFEPEFITVPLTENGMDPELLTMQLQKHPAKLMYVVPDFQNPSGISYSEEIRDSVADIIRDRNMILVEDTPYTDIRFRGLSKKSFYKQLPEKTVMLGTFSKTAVPGFRLGWVVAQDAVMDKLIIAKQAADLHTNIFTQQLLYDYLVNNDIEKHIDKICGVYGRQCDTMIACLESKMPQEVRFTRPDGGMFLWVTLPDGLSSLELFDLAMKRKLAFVPGNPFYVDKRKDCSTLRLNFSCSDEATISEGVRRLADAINELISKKNPVNN